MKARERRAAKKKRKAEAEAGPQEGAGDGESDEELDIVAGPDGAIMVQRVASIGVTEGKTEDDKDDDEAALPSLQLIERVPLQGPVERDVLGARQSFLVNELRFAPGGVLDPLLAMAHEVVRMCTD